MTLLSALGNVAWKEQRKYKNKTKLLAMFKWRVSMTWRNVTPAINKPIIHFGIENIKNYVVENIGQYIWHNSRILYKGTIGMWRKARRLKQILFAKKSLCIYIGFMGNLLKIVQCQFSGEIYRIKWNVDWSNGHILPRDEKIWLGHLV